MFPSGTEATRNHIIHILLVNVTRAFMHGLLIVLVRVGGAGKITLMDILAGKTRGGVLKEIYTFSC